MQKMINDDLVECDMMDADKILIDLLNDSYVLGDFTNEDNFQLMLSGVDDNDVVSMIAHLLLNIENRTGMAMEDVCATILKDQGKLVQEQQL